MTPQLLLPQPTRCQSADVAEAVLLAAVVSAVAAGAACRVSGIQWMGQLGVVKLLVLM